MDKSLNRKIHRLREDPSANEFILADAKDADMAFGLAATGECSQTGRSRSLEEFRDQIRQIVTQGLIDIALMSASTCEVLSGDEKIFDDSAVTPAIRANDSTDIWLAAGTGSYSEQPSLPFRSASIERVHDESASVADLGLYSLTLNNNAVADRETLEAYSLFRYEAELRNFRHFLEIFPPNAPGENAPPDAHRFVCDSVVRILAGLTRAERPLFLKIPYLGAELTERLVTYDPSPIVGIMGGAAGTTHDSFALLAEAKRHGVRAALFGRRINRAECQLAFVQHLRWIADDDLNPVEAVRSYHGALKKANLKPLRSVEDDMVRNS